MLFDRRRIGRTTVVQPAKIVATDTGATHDCIVDNLTTLGACISVNAAITGEMPKNFDLTFDNCHTFWSCRVIWRNKNGGQVGVTWKSD
jgi:hypothetical protein